MSCNTYSARFGMDRTYSVNMVGQFDERPFYSERLALFTSSGSLPNSFILAPSKIQYQKPEYPNGYNAMIEKGLQLRFCRTHNDTDRCISQDKFPSRMETQAALEKSNYTLVLRGDTLGSDRWFQAIAAGTALIQVSEDERSWNWLPFPCAIPWRDFVLSIPRDKFMDDPINSVKQLISEVSEERLLQLQQLSLYYATDIDWTAHHSRVLENLLQESYFIPCRSFEESVCFMNSRNSLDKALCHENFETKHKPRTLSCN